MTSLARHVRAPLGLLLLVSAVVAVPLAARADEPTGSTASPGKSDDKAPEEPKVKVTAFALPHPDLPEARMVEVMRGVENGLKQNPRLEMKDLDSRLADFAQEMPSDQIEAARAAQKEGNQALLELRIPDAVQKLQEAVSGLAKVLPYIKKQELADAMASLAIAQYEGGDKKSGHDAFVELLTWRGDYVYDTARFPPKYVAQFDEAQRQVEKAKKGSILIHSTPEGAQAYVDGKYIGVTPCTADGQPVGRHFVTLKREGYKKAVEAVAVAKKGEARADVTLDRSEKYLLVEQARAKVESTLGADTIDPDAENLKAVLFVDQAVFVKAVAASRDRIAVDAWLYDLRTRKRLSNVHEVVSAAGVEVSLGPLATSLYAGVSYEGEMVAPEDKTPEMQKPKRFYQKGWFWAVVGAAAVVAGGAVGVYYVVQSQQPAACPDGFFCRQFGP